MFSVGQLHSLLHITRQIRIASINRKSSQINKLPSHDLRSSSVAAFCVSVLEEAESVDRQTTNKSIGAPRMRVRAVN